MKSKNVISFVCQECGYESPAYLGKCPECDVWNSFREFQTSSKFKVQSSKLEGSLEEVKPKMISEVKDTEKERIKSGFLEMDMVLGGGVVKGSVILLAGDPGVGKSTLLLQIALNIAAGKNSVELQSHTRSLSERRLQAKSALEENLSVARGPVGRFPHPTSSVDKLPAGARWGTPTPATPSSSNILYISAEESEEQIKLRAKRIQKENTQDENFLILSNTNTDAIISVISEIKPSLVIIDSIQTIESENLEGLAGSVGQVRYAAFSFIKMAKSLNIPVIIVGHVTKEGMVAGPMVLSHMVDVVLFLEGEKNTGVKMLRSFKNRFGPVDEVGIFQMAGEGMIEVTNPEGLFISKSSQKVPGSVLVATIEGTRPFLVEIQALVVSSKLPFPKRVVSGVDAKRVELLLAVLQKHCFINLSAFDVFVNVAGGIKISDPASDLGICLAIVSSYKNIALAQTVGISEVGLLGELRPVPLLDKRVREAKKLGFTDIVTSEKHQYLGQVIKELGK